MTSIYSIDNIKSRLLADSKAFELLINTIPAKFYISEDLDPEEHSSKYTFGKRKISKHEAKKNAILQKKLKFDPSVVKDTVSLIEKKNKEKKSAIKMSTSEDQESGEDDSNESDLEVSMDMDTCEFEKDDTASLKPESENPTIENNSTKIRAFSDISRQELLDKLHARIASQRNLRKANDPKKAEASLQKRKDKKSKKNSKKAFDSNKKSSQVMREQVVVDESLLVDKSIKNGAKTIKDEGDLTFSKFEFVGADKKKKGPTTVQNLLNKVENENKKLKALRETDFDKAKEIEEKKAWKKALQLSSGQKIRDDPKLLKKTLKRIQKKKNKSAEAWSDRLSKVKEDEAAKQSKREENLQARKDSVKNKKMGIKAKKQPKKPSNKGASKAGFRSKPKK